MGKEEVRECKLTQAFRNQYGGFSMPPYDPVIPSCSKYPEMKKPMCQKGT